MKTSVRFLLVVFLLAVAALATCEAGQRLRLIRRITAADLPAPTNETDAYPESPSTQQGSNNDSIPVVTTRLQTSEVLETSETSHRRRRPIPASSEPKNSTDLPNEVMDSPATTTRRPYVPVTRNVSPRTKSPVVKTSACTSADCELRTASTDEKSVVVKSNSTQDEVDEPAKKKTSKEKLQESSTVRPTDRTFNNIVSSSTAKIVIQEKIHTDILRHLTTVSYAHYETDYELDDDTDAFEAESQSAPGKRATPSYDHYDTTSDHVNFTTPRAVLFDEAYARVSEGIRQNLDDLVDRSEEYAASQSSDHFESSEQKDSGESPPTNQVSLEYVNHVNIISNDSATANSRRGDLFVDNGTHVDFERSSVQTKVIPEVSSTVKYIIDDVYSTTKKIPTKDVDDENNSIKGSASSVEDQQVEGAEGEAVIAKSDPQGSALRIDQNKEETSQGDEQSQRLRIDDRITRNPNQTTSQSLAGGSLDKPIEDKPPTDSSPKSDIEEEETPTTLRVNTQGRSRMFPSDKYYTYNINNTVEQTATDSISNKQSVTHASVASDTIRTSPRTRRPISTTEQYVASRRHIELPSPTLAVATVPRTRRPTQRHSTTERNSAGDNLRTTTSRGAVKFGGRNPEQIDDLYPIPPTAAAWSLATLKEPGRRTRIHNVTTTRAPARDSDEDNDSQASGSFNKQTTIYNILTPTSDTSSSEDDKDWYKSTEKSFVGLTTELPNIKRENFDIRVTTEYPSSEFTTEPSSTTIPTDSVDVLPTRRPEEMTTNLPNEEVDDDLRFDGITTQRSLLDDVDVTTRVPETDNTSTTQEPLANTQSPREDVFHDDKEEEVEPVTTESAVHGVVDVDAEDEGVNVGSHGSDVHNHKDGGVSPRPHEYEVLKEDTHIPLGQPGRDADGSKSHEEGNTSELQTDDENKDVEVKAHEESAPKDDDNHVGNIQPEGERHDTELGTKIVEINKDYGSTPTKTDHHDDEDSDYGGSVVTEHDTPVGGMPEKPVPSSTEDMSRAVTNTSTTTEPTPSTTPTTQVVSDVHTFTRVFVESSMQEFCVMKELFRKAVADLLTVGTGRTVTLDKVILRNIDPEQCADNSSSENVPGELTPVEMYVINDAGYYDTQLNNAFPLLWGHSDLDFPLRICKVDAVDETMTYTSAGSGNGAVIAAITISCIGALCLLVLAVLLVVMRKRQKKVNYGMRCTPVSLDAYSLDSVSIHGSTRRKGGTRASKRSYGNPAYDDPGSPSHPMNFASLANFAADRDSLEEEFSAIPHVTPKSDELPEGCETKNRYANVIPLPETRVMLSLIEDEPLSDYINGNYVRGPKSMPKCYIACQAPLQSTVNDFWRMVWEQQSKVIMMLTDLVENGVEKCADYLPPSEVLDCHRLFGDYQVTLKKREVREEYVISTLQLKNMESNSWREITHLWYLSWPSQGVPEEASSVIAFLIEARSYMKNSNGPSVIHCSPGTGRTGTVLACDLGIREFEQTRLIDVPRCVAKLRKDRAGCVQTRDQYAFIYKVLNLYATKLTGGALDSI